MAPELFNVAADVAGLGKLCGVSANKGHADHAGNAPHQIGFAHARGAEEQNVLFRVILLLERGLFEALSHVIVVIADRDGEHLFGFLLLNDEPIQVVPNLAWAETEITDFFDHFFVRGINRIRWGRGTCRVLYPRLRVETDPERRGLQEVFKLLR